MDEQVEASDIIKKGIFELMVRKELYEKAQKLEAEREKMKDKTDFVRKLGLDKRK